MTKVTPIFYLISLHSILDRELSYREQSLKLASLSFTINTNTHVAGGRMRTVVSKEARAMEIDLHGYHPNDIVHSGILDKIIAQAWEMGETTLCLIHGHGRNRGASPSFVNTNTGFFGLTIRSALRHSSALRQWIKISTLDCSHPGATSINLKRNPAPSRTELDPNLLPAPSFTRSWS